MEIVEGNSYTFDDVLLQPGHADFFREEVEFSTQFTRNIALDIPLVSSPMDTVTDHILASTLAKLGGIGIIHRNLRVPDQAEEVAKVKAEGLLVGAAIGSRPTQQGRAGYEERVERLLDAKADVILVDSAHGDSKAVISTIRALRSRYGNEIEIIGGNVATYDGAQRLIDAGADALRVGMGPGAICTTRIVSGMGVPQIVAIMETSRAGKAANVPIIADGGISASGDMVKALAAGASSVMLGRLFAETEEGCGETRVLTADEVPSRFKSIVNGAKEYKFKDYRGMGSKGAIQAGIEADSEEEYHGQLFDADVFVAEGVEGLVPCSGRAEDKIHEWLKGIEAGLYYVGAQTIARLQEIAVANVITQASLQESHPHHLYVNPHQGA